MDNQGYFDINKWQTTILDISSQRLGELGARQVAEGLATTDTVRHLSLANCNINDDELKVICAAFRDNRSVEILDLSENNISDVGMIYIADLLQQNTPLGALILEKNKIKKDGAEALGRALAVNKRLRRINLSQNRIREKGAVAIADALRVNNALQTLNVSRNEVNTAGAVALAEALQHNTALKCINLSFNLVGEGLARWGQTLTYNTTLLELDFERCLITAKDAHAFAENLTRISFISLNLSNNDITDYGMQPILDCFKEQSALRLLDISNTQVTAKSMDELANVLRLSPQLETLEIDCNDLRCEGISLLASTLKTHQSLTSLNCNNTGMDRVASISLAVALHSTQWFTGLSVCNNQINDEGCISMCYALKRMRFLQKLDFSGNQISSACKEELSSVFVNNNNLANISLTGNPISAELVNGVLSRRVAIKVLDSMDDKTRVMAPPAVLQPKRSAQHTPSAAATNNSLAYNIFNKSANGNTSYGLGGLTSGNVSASSIYGNGYGGLSNGTNGFNGTSASNSSLPNVQRVGSPSVLHAQKMLMESSIASATATHAATPDPSLLMSLANTTRMSNLTLFPEAKLHALVTVTEAMSAADEERDIGTYPPLIPTKNSLQHPYYPGFGVGRFSNSQSVQNMGDVVPYTIANSVGERLVIPHTSSAPPLSACTTAKVRRVHKVNPYAERALENNIGGLLVTERQLARAFQELDVDGNGYLDREEFKALFSTFENFGVDLNAMEVEDVVRRFKLDDDGKITWDEFCLLMCRVAQR